MQAGEGPIPILSRGGPLWACAARYEVGRNSSIEETRPVVVLRWAPTAAVRRARSVCARGSGWPPRCFLLPALRLIKRCSSTRRSRSSKRRSSQSVRRLATSCAAPKPQGTEASRSFERPSSNIEYSLLPCAVAAIMRNRQLEGMWSSVLAGSGRTLCVKSSDRCSEGSSTRRPGAGGAVWSSAPASPTVAVDAPRGSMMMSTTGWRHTKLSCPHRLQTLAPALRRPPQDGVEHVTRSMATNRTLVSSSTAEPTCWRVMCFMSPWNF